MPVTMNQHDNLSVFDSNEHVAFDRLDCAVLDVNQFCCIYRETWTPNRIATACIQYVRRIPIWRKIVWKIFSYTVLVIFVFFRRLLLAAAWCIGSWGESFVRDVCSTWFRAMDLWRRPCWAHYWHGAWQRLARLWWYFCVAIRFVSLIIIA